MQFTAVVHGRSMVPLEFTNVLYVPTLSSNLLSVLFLTTHRSFTTLIERDTLHFIRDNKIQFQAQVTASNSAFLLDETIPVQQFASLSSTSPRTLDLALCVIAICGCWAEALELQCQHQAPDRMSRVCVYCGVVRVKLAAEKRFSSFVFIASLQVCNTLFHP